MATKSRLSVAGKLELVLLERASATVSSPVSDSPNMPLHVRMVDVPWRWVWYR